MGDPLRVLHVITDLNTGGAELMLHRLAEHDFSEGAVHHRVISLRGMGSVGDRLERIGVAVEALGMGSLLGVPGALARLRRRIAELSPDIVQTWMYHGDFLGGLAARAAGAQNVVWNVRIADISSDIGVSRSTLVIRRLCARLSSHVPRRIIYVATSARVVHERMGYDPSKSVVIPNGYRLSSETHVAEARQKTRDNLGLSDDMVLVGTGGRFSPQKNYAAFVAAAGMVARDRPHVRFLMLGRDVDPDNRELAEWLQATGFADRFHLLGDRRDIADWLPALDIFALPSLGEGFPNIVAESMASKVPCIVTDVGDAAALVGDTGRVLGLANISGDLRDALVAWIDEAPAARRARGRAARDRIQRLFSIENIASRYRTLYNEVVRTAG